MLKKITRKVEKDDLTINFESYHYDCFGKNVMMYPAWICDALNVFCGLPGMKGKPYFVFHGYTIDNNTYRKLLDLADDILRSQGKCFDYAIPIEYWETHRNHVSYYNNKKYGIGFRLVPVSHMVRYAISWLKKYAVEEEKC